MTIPKEVQEAHEAKIDTALEKIRDILKELDVDSAIIQFATLLEPYELVHISGVVRGTPRALALTLLHADNEVLQEALDLIKNGIACECTECENDPTNNTIH